MTPFSARTIPSSDQELDHDLAELFRIVPQRCADLIAAYGYSRVSLTNEGEDDDSVQDQGTRIEDYAARQGWTLRRVIYDPNVSGRTNKRPGLRELIGLIKSGQVNVLIIDRIDRLARSVPGLAKILALLDRYNVRLISVRENIDFDSRWGRLMVYILGALAQFYSEALSEEVRLSRLQRAQEGLLAGAFRFGYCNGRCSACIEPNGRGCPHFGQPNRGDGRVRIPHPIESHAVRLAFEWYASGQYSDLDIAQRLNDEVVTLPDGSPVRFMTKGRPGLTEPQPFDRDAVRAILNNPVYAGYVTYRGSDPKTGAKFRRPQSVIEGQHEALVSLEQYRQVQQLRRNRSHRTTSLRNPARTYPLTGLLVCKEGQPLRGISSNGGRDRYYVDKTCQLALKGQKHLWHQKNVRADRVEAEVQAAVTRMALPQPWRERVQAYVLYDDGLDELERRRFAVRERLSRVGELYEDGLYPRARYEQKKTACLRDLDALDPAASPVGQAVADLLDDLPALWPDLTPDEQKTLYQFILESIQMQDERIAAIRPRPPFAGLLSTDLL